MMRPSKKLMSTAAVSIAAAIAIAGCGSSSNNEEANAESQGSASTSTVQQETASSSAAAEATQSEGSQQAAPQKDVTLEIRTTETLNGEEQPRYVPKGATAASLKEWEGNITVKKGEKVTLTIINTDDGSAPLAKSYHEYDNVLGGSETVDGKAVTSVPNGKVAHTFSSLELGINAPIPEAPTGSTDKIVLVFTAKKAGTFQWQCFAPCGSEESGWGGAMQTAGWMKGTITVVS